MRDAEQSRQRHEHDPLQHDQVPTPEQTWRAQRQAAELFDLPENTPLANLRFAVIDVETSSISPKDGHVVQVAVVTVDGRGNVIERWSSTVKPPDGKVGRSDIHGVTEEMAAESPTFEEVLPELLRQSEHKVEVAHNWKFDRRWIDTEMERVGHQPVRPAAVDTLQLARRAPQDFPVHMTVDENDGRAPGPNQLGNLCKHFGVKLNGWHNAEADAEATGRLLPHLLKEARMKTVGDLTRKMWDSHGPLSRQQPPEGQAA